MGNKIKRCKILFNIALLLQELIKKKKTENLCLALDYVTKEIIVLIPEIKK